MVAPHPARAAAGALLALSFVPFHGGPAQAGRPAPRKKPGTVRKPAPKPAPAKPQPPSPVLVAQLEAARADLQAAEARFQAAEARFRAGSATQDEVIRAQPELARARAELVLAEARLNAGPAAERSPQVLRARLEAARAAVEAAEGLLQLTRARVEAGIGSPLEVSGAQSGLAHARVELVRAVEQARAPGGAAAGSRAVLMAQVEAFKEGLQAAEGALQMADQRVAAGLAPPAEVLEARARLARARAELVLAEARLRTAAFPPPRPAAVRPVSPAAARLQAARTRFELALAQLEQGAEGDLERLYLWSRRWLEAERAVSPTRAGRVRAHQGHVARMKALEGRARARFEAGMTAAADVAAAEYYRAEAELGLAQARR